MVRIQSDLSCYNVHSHMYSHEYVHTCTQDCRKHTEFFTEKSHYITYVPPSYIQYYGYSLRFSLGNIKKNRNNLEPQG